MFSPLSDGFYLKMTEYDSDVILGQDWSDNNRYIQIGFL